MTDSLQGVSPAELRAIAASLRTGRLSTPLSALALAPYLRRNADTASPMLVRLTTEGLSSDHLAFFLDILASDRESRPDVNEAIELVSTGPEAVSYPTRDTRIVVRELFRQAQRSVLVAGYAVYQGRDVFQALAERMDSTPDLHVRMFLDVPRIQGDTSHASEILRRYIDRFRKHEWPGSRLPEIYYDPRSLDLEPRRRSSLHAKCVVVDDHLAFISSANFTEAAQVRNIEVGVLIRSSPFARQLSNHFLTLADRHALERVPGI